MERSSSNTDHIICHILAAELCNSYTEFIMTNVVNDVTPPLNNTPFHLFV